MWDDIQKLFPEVVEIAIWNARYITMEFVENISVYLSKNKKGVSIQIYRNNCAIIAIINEICCYCQKKYFDDIHYNLCLFEQDPTLCIYPKSHDSK